MAIQARTEFASALNQVCSERGLEPEVVLDSIKQAILAAYKKDYGEPEDITVDLNATTGEVALVKNKKDITPSGFGRIAAQTAKQVILQRIREAEKNAILDEYSSKIGTILSGLVQRISGPLVTVNLGKTEAIMPPAEQAHNEHYYQNQRLKVFVVGIKEGIRGDEIIVSRSANGLLEGLFKQEVPELGSGSVEIKDIAREAGSRSKIAVASTQAGVDPVGSCVGQRGVRVQAVINELGDEKIDVIAYQEDPVEYIKSALAPAKDLSVKIDDKSNTAEVTAPDDQLSLAIGKDGQNVRLAAKLTGYKIDIRGKSGTPKEVEAKEKKAQAEAKKALGVTQDDKSATDDSGAKAAGDQAQGATDDQNQNQNQTASLASQAPGQNNQEVAEKVEGKNEVKETNKSAAPSKGDSTKENSAPKEEQEEENQENSTADGEAK